MNGCDCKGQICTATEVLTGAEMRRRRRCARYFSGTNEAFNLVVSSHSTLFFEHVLCRTKRSVA